MANNITENIFSNERFFADLLDNHTWKKHTTIGNKSALKYDVLIEKNLSLIKWRRKIKDNRLNRIQYLYKYVKDVTAHLDGITDDVTSLSNIDFQKPCTTEEIKELYQKFSYYFYPDCIDEVNCEVKFKDVDGVDNIRMLYGQYDNDSVANSIKENFTNCTERLSENYLMEYHDKVDKIINVGIRRNVMVEKTGYGFFSEKKYKRLGFDNAREYIRSPWRELGRLQITRELHHRLNYL